MKTALNGFIKIVNEPNRRPNKFWTEEWLLPNLHQKLLLVTEILVIASVIKKNPWTYKIKHLNG